MHDKTVATISAPAITAGKRFSYKSADFLWQTATVVIII
jgi:hypothetical protein